MKLFAKLLSIFFHPLLMPTLGLFLIFNTGSHISFIPLDVRRMIYLSVFVSSCLLPLSLIPLLLMLNQIKSIYMESRKERILPIFIAGIFYFLGYYFLKLIPSVPSFILNYILATLIAVYMALLITFFWKISIHMIGLGGLAGGILAFSIRFGLDLHVWLALTILIAGLVGVARIYLNAHNSSQIYMGFLSGFAIVFTSILFQ